MATTFGLHELMLRGASIEDRLALAADLGADSIELMGGTVVGNEAGVARSLERHHLAPGFVCGGYRGAVLDPRPASRREAASDLALLFEAATEIGAPGVEVALLKRPPLGPSVEFPDLNPWMSQREVLWGFATSYLNELGEIADRYGSTLVIEPQNRYLAVFTNTVVETVELCSTVGHHRVAPMADLFHMNVEEDGDLSEVLRASARSLRNFHLRDSTGGLPGTGHLDVARLVRTLAVCGYEGPLILEPTTGDTNDSTVSRALEHVRGWWQEGVGLNSPELL